ncbi:hypothetical protein Q1695_006101 [Nippostrongylus brasiliensis]|nr:hypothetical protein Q1695_006101 [Nippostrongylus brasiliensis]
MLKDYVTFDCIYGSLSIATAVVVLVLYCLIFKIILSDYEFRNSLAYRFIILLGVFDLMEAGVHCVTGIVQIDDSVYSEFLGNLLGSILIPAYFCYNLTSFLLAFVRCIQIVFPTYETILFGSNRGNCWLFIVVAVFLPYCGLMYSPLSQCWYNVTRYTWDYDFNRPLSFFAKNFEQYIQQTIIFATFGLYLVIFFVLWKMRNSSASPARLGLRVLYQTFIVTIYCTVLNLLNHNVWWINSKGDPLIFAILNYCWLLNTAVFPVSLFLTNRVMQRRVVFSLTKINKAVVSSA